MSLVTLCSAHTMVILRCQMMTLTIQSMMKRGNNSDTSWSQHSQVELNVLNPIDHGDSRDVTLPEGFDTDYAY